MTPINHPIGGFLGDQFLGSSFPDRHQQAKGPGNHALPFLTWRMWEGPGRSIFVVGVYVWYLD